MDEGATRQTIEHGAETVYGTHEDGNMVMSEKVKSQNPFQSIYLKNTQGQF